MIPPRWRKVFRDIWANRARTVLIKDEKAIALIAQMMADENIRYGFARVKQIPLSEANKLVLVLRNREFDRYARDFLKRHPDAVIVHIGCGLDSRFERVDNGQVEWYDLDFPPVIELRRKYLGDERERYHMLGASVFEEPWLEAVSAHGQHPFLFLAEGVFMYFKAEQVRSLVLTMRDHFPGAELVFDGWVPFWIWLGNRQLSLSNSQFTGLLHWGFCRGQEIEGWGDGIHLLGEWGYFDCPEPRLDSFRWMAPIFRLFKPMRIFHFQLGKAAR